MINPVSRFAYELTDYVKFLTNYKSIFAYKPLTNQGLQTIIVPYMAEGCTIQDCEKMVTRFQCRTEGHEYKQVMDRAHEIYNAINTIEGEVDQDYFTDRIILIRALDRPVLPFDEDDRLWVANNFEAIFNILNIGE